MRRTKDDYHSQGHYDGEDRDESGLEIGGGHRLIRFMMQFSMVWLVIVALAMLTRIKSRSSIFPEESIIPKKVAAAARERRASRARNNRPPEDQEGEDEEDSLDELYQKLGVPRSPLASFGAYPNPLHISEEDRASFHPVLKLPMIWVEDETGERRRKPNYQILDLRMAKGVDMIASQEERERAHRAERSKLTIDKLLGSLGRNEDYGLTIGRFDENRASLYSSRMFRNKSVQIDGYSGSRTLHLGIDLGGPVGTRVFAFCDGVVHKAGYNPEVGDYGNVLVLEHDLGPSSFDGKPRKLWALYGHLDEGSIKGMTEGKKIRKGKQIGRLGDVHQNGGWKMPHVHFQLSTFPPATHDMPGVVSMDDRLQALQDYLDPRLILGALY